ncbi:ABC transporter permease [Paenibacillus thermotolerans]|uniref:ABC transporter permease n=1 Tax=Paenibacillus thermotolerans TaxID=3027807 RepID=UPI002368DB34|nr:MULTISPECIES: ABC transporter permease [unclassified Paenibacillus]
MAELQKSNRTELTPDLFRKVSRDSGAAEKIERESLSAWQDIWFRLKENKFSMFCLYIIIFLVLMAIFGPMMTGYSATENDLLSTNMPPMEQNHWFGTDDFGRDMFARTWEGAKVSLQVGVYAALADLIIGVIYGGIMGYVGGRIGETMNKIAEVLYAIPNLLIAILLLVVFKPSLLTIVIALSITGWINMAWIVRGQIMQLKNQEYVLASRSLGASPARILFRHLIPNSMGPIIVTLTLTVPGAIFAEAFLSFLGLGVQVPFASWGTMINDALAVMQLYPWRILFPAFFISLTMLAFNVLGDGLRDAFDPKMKR